MNPDKTAEGIIQLLMSRGMPRWDAETALVAYQKDPAGADGCRVASILEAFQ